MINLLRELLSALPRIPPEIKARFQDETLCRRCGKCCCAAVRVKGRMVLLPQLCCRYLRPTGEGKTECSIYPVRERTGFCFRISADSIRRELFPPDCPYVEGVINYRGKEEISPEEFAAIKPILRNLFALADRPQYIRQKDWDQFLYLTLELPRPEPPKAAGKKSLVSPQTTGAKSRF